MRINMMKIITKGTYLYNLMDIPSNRKFGKLGFTLASYAYTTKTEAQKDIKRINDSRKKLKKKRMSHRIVTLKRKKRNVYLIYFRFN